MTMCSWVLEAHFTCKSWMSLRCYGNPIAAHMYFEKIPCHAHLGALPKPALQNHTSKASSTLTVSQSFIQLVRFAGQYILALIYRAVYLSISFNLSSLLSSFLSIYVI